MLFWKCGKEGKGASRSHNSQHTSTAHTPPSHTRTSVKPSSSFQACSRAPRRAALSLRQVQEGAYHDFIVNGRSTDVARHTAACVSDVTCV